LACLRNLAKAPTFLIIAMRWTSAASSMMSFSTLILYGFGVTGGHRKHYASKSILPKEYQVVKGLTTFFSSWVQQHTEKSTEIQDVMNELTPLFDDMGVTLMENPSAKFGWGGTVDKLNNIVGKLNNYAHDKALAELKTESCKYVSSQAKEIVGNCASSSPFHLPTSTLSSSDIKKEAHTFQMHQDATSDKKNVGVLDETITGGTT